MEGEDNDMSIKVTATNPVWAPVCAPIRVKCTYELHFKIGMYLINTWLNIRTQKDKTYF
jgi:hypothetical protein